MADELGLRFKNSLASMISASEQACQWLIQRGASDEIRYLANLAIEELATNCIKFGYDDAAEHLLGVKLSLHGDQFVLTFTDDGRPFDPLAAPVPDVTLPAEERSVGGLGIYLLRQMADRMEYARKEGRNQVLLTKACHSR